jgi:signal transduction histidine kinase
VPLELRDKIFDPFFTTKGRNKGIGLGLSISQKIVESHHGELILDADFPNTRFLVRLPKRQPRYNSALIAEDESTSTLVVDDKSLLRPLTPSD